MVFRRRRSEAQPASSIDPQAVAGAYRAPVADALRARDQFDRLVAAVAPGPLQDRLRELRGRVDAGVHAVWETAQRATELERVVTTLDPDRVTAELKQARRSGADPEVVEALSSRFASTQRLLNALDEMRNRLPVLEARLGTAVARAADLALTASATTVAELDRDLEHVVVELEALSRATAELR